MYYDKRKGAPFYWERLFWELDPGFAITLATGLYQVPV